MRPLHRLVARSALLFLGFGVGVASGQTYRPIDLGSLSGWTVARAVNNSGVVVGSTVGGRGRFRGFVWDGQLSAIRTPTGFTQAQGMDVNALDRAVFAVYSMGDVATHAIVLEQGAPTELDDFCPRAINRAGGVVGTRDAVDPATGLLIEQAVLWSRGTLRPLPQLSGGTSCSALDVSNNGRIVGSAFAQDALAPIAVLWHHGAITTLGTLGRTPAQATCISPSGRYVAGVSATATAPLHAFRYKLDAAGAVRKRRDLGTLDAGGWSVAYDTNNAGEVVGTSDGRAFLFSQGRLIDLNTTVNAAHGWTLIGATGINAGGDIVGWGDYGHLGLRAFLLARVCSPADLVEPFGVLDSAGLNFYLAQSNAGNLAEADLTSTAMPGAPGYGVPDGVLTNDDQLYYLSLYSAGCLGGG